MHRDCVWTEALGKVSGVCHHENHLWGKKVDLALSRVIGLDKGDVMMVVLA